METIYFEFKDILRNKLIDILRMLAIGLLIVSLFSVNPDYKELVSITVTLLLVLTLFFFRKLKVLIYYDAIQFKMNSLNPRLNKESAILFEKIERIEVVVTKIMCVYKFVPGFKEVYFETITFHIKDRKPIIQRISLKQKDFVILKKVLNDKIIEFNRN